MKQVLCRAGLGAVVISLIALTFGCNDDVTVPKPPGLEGTYRGTYSYLSISNAADTTISTSYPVKVIFDRPTFNMIPTDLDSIAIFCEVTGEYVQESESLRISKVFTEPGFTRGLCDDSFVGGVAYKYTLGDESLTLVADESSSANGGQVTRIIRRLALKRIH